MARFSNYAGLHEGEREALALADEYDARLILLDEKKARRQAKAIGLTVKGIAGILLEAKEDGLVDVSKLLL